MIISLTPVREIYISPVNAQDRHVLTMVRAFMTVCRTSTKQVALPHLLDLICLLNEWIW